MAPLSSLHCPQLSHFFTALSSQKGLKKYKKLQLICCGNNEVDQNLCFVIRDQFRIKRREALIQTAFTGLSFPAIVSVALADEDDFRVYLDDVNKFKIIIPRDWQVGAGESNGIKSVTAFFPGESSSSNVSIVITGLGADFTRLESFGKVDAFADTLVSGLDRSWQRPPGVAAKLIDCKAANGLYYIEYTLQKPGESRRHLFSVLGMANNGWYNRLYTVTGQFVEEDLEKYSSQIEKAVASFRLI
ncbi:psbP domain-containing protein 3, chloroplastic isoform X2 [Cornus florida]|uniref:psbP domain-containing protein 3, chloroplastic isoform X2 n=1 Tax=Cornus florida TaxID=4283 RepID=UPI00289A691C|nr:psbP domain-containing protein 3, chloroplastic isoform X2 [Cornus florida]